ncbi:hypothetical protein ACFU7Y_36880 [Kitasatospora sp. NPDC057542]|uniref:hypothetical protein n=1 Tax=Streptomycetaceae TaxID=2062 RepID=UPI0035A8C222
MAVDGLLATLAGPRDTGLHTITHIERIRVGPDRRLTRRDSQHALRADRDGIDRYLALYQGDPGSDITRVGVRAEENCRPGRIRRDQAHHLRADVPERRSPAGARHGGRHRPLRDEGGRCAPDQGRLTAPRLRWGARKSTIRESSTGR